MCIVSCDHLEAVFSGTINDNVSDGVYWSRSRIHLKIRVGKHKAFQAAVVAVVRSEELMGISFHAEFEVMTTSKRIEDKLSSGTSHSITGRNLSPLGNLEMCARNLKNAQHLR
jgi:hypothetical protein